jgi:DNA-binding SARP family transcriptional activator
LPGALLAMIDERTARTAIDSSLVPLPTPEIRVLGSRVLGATAFEEQASVVGDAYCTVRLLGGLEIRVGDRTITERDWRKRKARLLFVMLAVHRGCDIARERIFDHLWPDMTEEQARNNFYVAWSTMKSALTGGAGRSGACPFVQSRRGRCRIDSRFVSLDIDEFEQLVHGCRDAMRGGEMGALLEGLTRLDQVYRGDLLPGDLYDDWFVDMRERCRLDFLDTMAQGALSLAEHGRVREALGFARRALHQDPTREDLYQIEMHCQALSGQRTAAMDTFMRCRRRLAEDLGLDPSAQTRAMYQQLLSSGDLSLDWPGAPQGS